MKRRLSAALVFCLGLCLWPADGTTADSMSGGGVSSSGSQPWTGGHNNMPRQNLSPVGTVFTPPTSFGNIWIVNNAANQSIACPSDIADGDSLNVHIQYGAGAPYSPAISFSAPCYGWTTGPQPSWSENTTQADWAFCQSMNPPDVSGASFVCAPQLNVKPPVVGPQWVTGALGTSTGGGGGTSSAVTLSASPTQSLLCQVNWISAAGATVTSLADGGGTNLTAGDTSTGGNNHSQLFYEINITGHSVSALTVNYSASVTFGQARCDVIGGATSLVSGGHALTILSNVGGGTNAVTTGSVSSAVSALVWGAATSTTGAVTLAAGSNFTLREQDTSGTNWNSTTETKISSGTSDVATFTNSSATATNNFVGTLIVQ